MPKYLIVVEGKADAVFLKEYLSYVFKNNANFKKPSISDKIEMGKSISVFDVPIVKVLISGGCTNIKKYKTPLLEHRDEGYKVIFIQDADDPSKDYGGITMRMHFLETQKKELGVDFDVFLFPNHKDDGDLETLLISIAKEDKYNPFYRHYGHYVESTGELNERVHCIELLDNKLKVYNYCQVYTGMEKAKEENREYEIIYWDLDHYLLEPLLSFLKSIVNLVDNT